jgi:hypothetical protein
LKLIEGHRVQITMRVRVVTQLESCVQPHPEEAYPAVDIANSPALDEQLALVDETYGRNAVPAHCAQQLTREFLEAGHIAGNHTCRGGRQIVKRHCDSPFGRGSVRDCVDGQQ